MGATVVQQSRNTAQSPPLIVEGLRSLLRHGTVEPQTILAVEELTALPARLGHAQEGAEAAITVCAALGRVLDHSRDREVAQVLFGIDERLRDAPLGARRELAAELSGVTPGSFRVRREPRLLEELSRALLVELAVTQSPSAPPAPNWHLEMKSGSVRATIPLPAGRFPVVVGRDPSCDVQLRDDELVSRIHLELSIFGDRCRLSDLGSSNGTTVNGQRVTDHAWLRDGDAITIGRTEMTFRVDAGNPAATAPAPE